MKHLLGIEQLNKEQLMLLVNNGESFVEVSERDIKKVPSLRGKTIINLFMEPSTRTRASFEIAGKRLSADTINLGSTGSSSQKGESLLDTARTLQAMNPDAIVIRHKSSGAPHFLAKFLKNTSIINAGDGMHEHPTQALLDCITLQQHFRKQNRSIEGLKVAIVGDVRHSRVARSNIWAHGLLGNEIRLVGPSTLVPEEYSDPTVFPSCKQVSVHHDLIEGIKGADVIYCLRVQQERLQQHFIPSLQEYTNEYFVSSKLVNEYAPNAVIMHAGPVIRGVEVATDLIDGPRSLVENQVNNGVAVRMAVLFQMCTGGVRETEKAA